jgi:hypothetical protein
MRKVAAGAALALVLLVVGASAAGAASFDGGCKGSGVSKDGDGKQLDTASAPGQGGTSSDPFLVDHDGTVDYEGSSPTVFHNHSWHVDVSGATVKSGGSKNGTNQASTSGTVKVDDYLPVNAVGLYKVTGGITATEGSCSGSAWVKVAGSPVGTVAWIAGIGFTVIGAAGLAFTARPIFGRGG